MEHTLLSVFDNRADAQDALDALLEAGFSRTDVMLSEGDPTRPGVATGKGAEAGVLDSIRHYFVDLFGTDRSEATRLYSDAVTRGHYVLTLGHDDQDEIERAADIIEGYGPVDIDEKDRQWRGGAMLQGGGAHQGAASQSQQFADPGQESAAKGVGAMRRSTPGSKPLPGERSWTRIYRRLAGEPAANDARDADQRRAIDHMSDPADVPAFQQGRGGAVDGEGAVPLVGEMIIEGEILTADEAAVFREHWQRHYAAEGEFSDYAPAYRFGSRKRASEGYRSHSWSESEHNLRADWEAMHPTSAWSRFKAAVKAGWDRITS